MALTDFKPQFDEAYQEIFQKVLVSKEIANMRFKEQNFLTVNPWNVSLTTSPLFAFAPYRVEAQARLTPLTDSSELLTVKPRVRSILPRLRWRSEASWPLLTPGEVIGGKIVHLVAQHLDATFFAEVLNADNDFDTGDLTTLVSSGVPFSESTTNVPIMVSRMPAKLRRNNQTLNNLCFVTDSYGASSLVQYLLGKDIDLAGSVFKNGYAGTVASAEVYVSENLTGTAVLVRIPSLRTVIRSLLTA